MLLCGALALFAYKALNAYRDVREQWDIIQETVLENNIELAKSSEVVTGYYEFDYGWLDENCLIAHALGGIDGINYTNSLEALEAAYNNGYRVFEGDMQLLDGRVVLMHDEKHLCEASGISRDALDYDAFIEAKLYGEYSTLDAEDIVHFLSEHPDAYFMTDSKYALNPYSANVLSGFVIAALEYDESVLDRVIVQIYNQNMLETVMDVYPFKSVVYTLYQSYDTDDEALSFCLRSGVGAVTAHSSRMTEEFSAKLGAAGVLALVHTLNDEQEIESFFDMGVSAVYSDFALPENTKR